MQLSLPVFHKMLGLGLTAKMQMEAASRARKPERYSRSRWPCWWQPQGLRLLRRRPVGPAQSGRGAVVWRTPLGGKVLWVVQCSGWCQALDRGLRRRAKRRSECRRIVDGGDPCRFRRYPDSGRRRGGRLACAFHSKRTEGLRLRGQAPDAVGVELAVGAEHRDTFDQRLRDDHPIEGVAVQGR